MITAVWMMIRQQMVCVICVYRPHTGRTEAEKEAFIEEQEQEQEYLFDPKNVYFVSTVDTINIIKIIMVANDISCKPNFEDT